MKFQWDEIEKSLKAEARSKLVGGAVTLLLWLASILGLWIFSKYLPPESHDPKTGALTAASVWEWAQHYPSQHPKRTIVYAAGFSLAAAVFVALVRIFTVALMHLSKLSDSFRLRKAIGLSAIWPSASAGLPKINPWDRLRGYILDRGNPILYVLGATGIATFGPGSPLQSIIENFHGDVRILLMSPKSDHLPARALSLQMSEADYRREIGKAIREINGWRKKNGKITYRMYDSVPNWKLILTKEVAWVQYYRTALHVDQTPVYHFYATSDGNGLYHLFLAEFHRIWSLCPTAQH